MRINEVAIPAILTADDPASSESGNMMRAAEPPVQIIAGTSGELILLPACPLSMAFFVGISIRIVMKPHNDAAKAISTRTDIISTI